MPWWLLAVPRAAVLALSVPLLAYRLPVSVRLALAVVVAAVLFPAATASMGSVAPSAPGMLFIREAALGLALALLAGAAVWGAEVAGRASDAARGRPALTSPLGEAFGLGAVVILLATGAHRVLIRATAAGYSVLPPDQPLRLGPEPLEVIVHGSGAIMAFGLAVAVPALAVSLAIRLAAAVSERAAPWLSSRMSGASAASLAVVAVSALVAGLLVSGLGRTFDEGLDQVRDLLRALGGS